jgi:hypothetical protein
MVSPGDASGGDASGENIPVGNIPSGDALGGDASGGKAISVYFPDDNLEAAVRSALSTDVSVEDVVTTAQLAQITELTVDAVTDWTGIELLTNLGYLEVLPSVAYDISNLAGLSKTNATFLLNIGNWETDSVNNSHITGDISVFSDMTKLNGLSIASGTKVYGDLSSLSKLTSLELLNFGPSEESNNITGKISDLSQLTELTRLIINWIEISGTYSEISSFTNLTTLYVTCKNITGSLGDLKSLSKLEELNLDSNTFNLNELSGGLPNLKFLYLSGKIAGSLDELGTWKKLINIGLWDRGLDGEPPSTLTGDIAYFAKCPNLEYFSLVDLPVSGKTSSLAGLENLYYNIEGTNVIFDDNPGTVKELFQDANLAAAVAATIGCEVTDQVTQTRLGYITELTVDAVTDWTGIELLTNLEFLNVIPSAAYDISNLAGLSKINNRLWLNIGEEGSGPDVNIKITGNISVFSEMTNLYVLTISNGAKVSGDLSSLSELTSLERLTIFPFDTSYITGKISDLSKLTRLTQLVMPNVAPSGTYLELSSFTNLTYLVLSCENITDSIDNLKSLSSLEYLVLYNNVFNINDLSGSLPNLKSLNFIGTITGSLDGLDPWENLVIFQLSDWGLNGKDPASTLTGDIAYFAGCPNLESIFLMNQPVSGNISSLDSLEKLNDLHVDGSDVIFDDYAGTVKELFPDTHLAAAVADALECDVTDSVSSTLLESIVSLQVDAVKNWTGIELLTSLGYLDVFPSAAYDISNLAGLSKINNRLWLNIGEEYSELTPFSNHITGDISVFSEMTNLYVLTISHYAKVYGDLSSLSELTSLEILSITQYDISDITGKISDLSKLTRLTQLTMANVAPSGTYSEFSSLTNLTDLYMSCENITGSIGDLKSLSSLEDLALNSNVFNINDLSGSLPNLKYLSFQGTITGSLDELDPWENLVSINLSDWGLNGKDPASTLTGDIAYFAGCPNLWSIFLKNQPVSGKISSLDSLKNLSQ